jgi:hypothetical protein
LSSIKGFASIIYNMYLAFFSLSQHGSYDVVASVAPDIELLASIGRLNDRHGYESSLYCPERYQALLIKIE